MSKKAIITAIEGYVPDYILTNDELSTMVDTTKKYTLEKILLQILDFQSKLVYNAVELDVLKK